MNISIINTFIKYLSINLGTIYSAFKIINNDIKLSIPRKILIGIMVAIVTYIESILKSFVPTAFIIILIYTFNATLFKILAKVKPLYSAFITIISFSIAYIGSFLASAIIALFFYKLYFCNIQYTPPVILASVLNIIILYLLFRIRRFKNGFPFLRKYENNEYFNILILTISILIIFMYFLYVEYSHIRLTYLLFGFIFFIIILLIILQKTFILYHKQKLQTQALKDYEHELEETKQKLATAIEEKEKLVKSNHEFYHRQEALKKKLDDLLKQTALSMNSEYGEDYGDIQDRINKLSDEYIAKTKVLPVLPKTHITEIDDMLTYMQSECDKNNIEFILKIDCDINHILENFVTQSQLETLLGDLIRNAIIAINHTSNSFKSIMVMFGIKDDSYELCIYDSGIPFEISTLVNLGLKPASTHESEGGTGIGFITTFETINSCNASFIINEITNNNYTKSLEIKFDNKNEYIIISERRDEIKKANLSNRNIIIKG